MEDQTTDQVAANPLKDRSPEQEAFDIISAKGLIAGAIASIEKFTNANDPESTRRALYFGSTVLARLYEKQNRIDARKSTPADLD